MIEKTFEKTYDAGAKNGVLTRVANRLIKEYNEAIGKEYGLPDEVNAAAEKIKQMQEVESYEDEFRHTVPCTFRGDRPYDTVTYEYQVNISAYWEKDEYGDDVFAVRWYFFNSQYYVKRIGNQKITGKDLETIIRKGYAARGKYRYFCTHRPPAPYCIPNGYVSYETYYQGSEQIGEVTYNEQPPAAELQNWGLILDKDYERVRAAYMGAE
jgi:hypothetical protein